MSIQAVLTGDIVNSTRLTPAKEKKLTQALEGLFAGSRFEFFRGDSFQALEKLPQQALRLALLCRTAAICVAKDDKQVLFDVRISIGLGSVSNPVRSLRTAKGAAFVLSGRYFDAIAKSNTRLVMATEHPLANEGLQVIAHSINVIFSSMSGKQAEVVHQLLQGETQQDVAKKLKKTKSSIHQRVTAARWPEIEQLLLHYENIINLIA